MIHRKTLPETDPNAEGDSQKGFTSFVRNTLLITWIGGLYLFFFIRFSFVFYDAHSEAINGLVSGVFGQ